MALLSHHSSNPLEADASDPINALYNAEYNEVAACMGTDDDELNDYRDPDTVLPYQRHLREILEPRASPRTRAQSQKYLLSLKRGEEAQKLMSDDPIATAQVHVDNIGVRTPKKDRKIAIQIQHLDDMRDESPLTPLSDEVDDELVVEKTPVPLQEDEDVLMYAMPDDAEDEPGPEPTQQTVEDTQVYEDDTQVYDDEYDDDDEPLVEPGEEPLEAEPIGEPDVHHYSSSDAPDFDSSEPVDRTPEEQRELDAEIQQLYRSVPELEQDYEVIDRLGTGTFSSVYKAIDLNYHDWHNAAWLGNQPENSSAYYHTAGPSYRGRGGRAPLRKNKDKEREQPMQDDDVTMEGHVVTRSERDHLRAYVAIKRIYVTSGPERIRNELDVLQDTRSCRHTSHIITAFRNEDQIVVVQPLQRHVDFREFYMTLPIEGVKCYMRCLLRALRDVHARGIIHRDVKPANFLFDPFTGIGTLCDFGLASRVDVAKENNLPGLCLHHPWSKEHPHGRLRTLGDDAKAIIKARQREARSTSDKDPEKVGWPAKDTRPVSKANRAGTRGFRAPEVLLKCAAQTGAIDVWSAGVTLLFFLSCKYPIFNSNDDIEGLMEIAVVIGKKSLERAATLHGRVVATNVPSIPPVEITWRKFAVGLNPSIEKGRITDHRFYPFNAKNSDGRDHRHRSRSRSRSRSVALQMVPRVSLEADDPFMDNSASTNPEKTKYEKDLNDAFNLLQGLLDPLSTTRITPAAALAHPFLAEYDEQGNLIDDDDFVPHLIGEGVCGKLHKIDKETGNHHAQVRMECDCHELVDLDEEEEVDADDNGVVHQEGCPGWGEKWLELEMGEGVPIGRRPCEFHEEDFEA